MDELYTVVFLLLFIGLLFYGGYIFSIQPKPLLEHCNGKTYTPCSEGKIFICDEKGARCEWDPATCEQYGLHLCQGKCWAGCTVPGTHFICDDVRGGVCIPY